MSTPDVIAYRPEFAFLPDADGRAIGHSAALLLSQLVYLQSVGGEPVERTMEQIAAWGFTRTEQETVRRKLRAAGYLHEERAGARGAIRFSVCGKPANWLNQNAENLQTEPSQNVENPQTEPIRMQEIRKLNGQNAENLQTDLAVCGKPTNCQNAENLHSESFKKTLIPPVNPPSGDITPPEGEREPTAPAKRRRALRLPVSSNPPTPEEVNAYLVGELRGSIADAEQFLDYWQSRGWRGKNERQMYDWRAMCRTWMANARRWEQERKPPPTPATRGSPRNTGMEERRSEIRSWFEEET